jgi:hypothetical protein
MIVDGLRIDFQLAAEKEGEKVWKKERDAFIAANPTGVFPDYDPTKAKWKRQDREMMYVLISLISFLALIEVTAVIGAAFEDSVRNVDAALHIVLFMGGASIDYFIGALSSRIYLKIQSE